MPAELATIHKSFSVVSSLCATCFNLLPPVVLHVSHLTGDKGSVVTGYVLFVADGLDDLLLVAESEQIESLSLGDAVEKNVVADGLQHPSAVDYDASEQRVIFSDTGQHVIASQLLNGTGGSERLTNQELHSPFAGVAFDWISRLVFYSDYQVIVTCRPDGHYTKPVVFTSPSQPGPIVADAQRGFGFFVADSFAWLN